ncbi:MAG: hypothetical protein ACRD1X_05765 [Vicinamibacteria bacterium]
MALSQGAKWVRFLRQYGPVPRNDNMYDEHIRRSAQRAGVRPIAFTHPLEEEILSLFRAGAARPSSVVLTGTAGDGKTHLCRKIWSEIGGDEDEWNSDDIYYRRSATIGGRPITVHVIRDLTALPRQDSRGGYADKDQLLLLFCRTLLHPAADDVFLIAANDGQLIEPWQRLPATDEVGKVRQLFESLLVEDRRESEGTPLKFFNLSRVPCVSLFDLALEAFLSHEGWHECDKEAGGDGEFFGPRCPIRRNYELLQTPLVKTRLRALFELCDCNDLHTPIRRILLLLANAVLGHPEVKDRLMQAADVLGIIQKGTAAKGSLFTNIFGGNLSDTRRESLEVFDYLNRFRIGHETSNRIDNILIFGEADENLRPYFDALLGVDPFYGADPSYYAAQQAYIEGAEGDEAGARAFLDLLVSQRRRLFFTIPEPQERELALWELTVFKYAGEYLSRVLRILKTGGKVERSILARLVRGLNRVFVGMLVTTDRELLLATSFSFSSSKVSQILEDRIPVTPRLSERVEFTLDGEKPAVVIQLSSTIRCGLPLNLTRYEFLSRVAEGALPGSFSRECYEDLLAFKSKLLACLAERRQIEGVGEAGMLTFRLMNLDASGNPADEIVEVSSHG